MLLGRRFSCKYLPGSDAFENLDDTTRGDFGVRSAEKVDMVLIHAHGLDFDLVSFLYTHRSFLDYPNYLFVKKRFSVLDREDNVVMNLPRTMVPFSNSAFRIHPVSITTCPCSKLQGTVELEFSDWIVRFARSSKAVGARTRTKVYDTSLLSRLNAS